MIRRGDFEKKKEPELSLDAKSTRMAYILWGHMEAMHPNCGKPNLQDWAETFRNSPKTPQIALDDMKVILRWIKDSSIIWRGRYITPEAFLRNYEKLRLSSQEPSKAEPSQTRILPPHVKKNIELLHQVHPSYILERENYLEHSHNGDRINLDMPTEEFLHCLLKWANDYHDWEYRERHYDKIPVRFHKL